MNQSENPIKDAFLNVIKRIRNAEQCYGRTPDSVQLLAVSKTFSAEHLRYASELGQQIFGENYLQEALEKQRLLADLGLCWHFIGPLQSNKSRAVAEHFSWVHSVDRLKLARRLSEQRPEAMDPLNVCLQVNVSGETSKSGMAPSDVLAMAASVVELPGLRLRGLMALPAVSHDFSTQRRAFAEVAELYQTLIEEGFDLDTLSMGMSGDLEAAIAEGATMVRVGSGLFGARNYK